MTVHYTDDDVTVYAGDCRDVLRDLPDASVDAVITDPPYELGFMGKAWDSGGVAYDVAMWREALRVLKPGGHLLAFGGTRTAHRLAVAIEDAGFELRDSITWLYGSGFPKSLDVSKAIDRQLGAEREVIGQRTDGRYASGFSEAAKKAMGSAVAAESETGFSGAMGVVTAPATEQAKQWAGWGSALKPAHEPIVVARKPFAGTLVRNVLEHGAGALNVDGCRVALNGDYKSAANGRPSLTGLGDNYDPQAANQPDTVGRWPTNIVLSHSPYCELVGQVDVATDTHYPAARGRGGISVNGHSGQGGLEERTPGTERIDAYDCAPGCPVAELGDEARYFPTFRYEPKAATEERPTADGVVHPTVKPLDLMRWLVRLVVPRGATVLDCFAGSGTTGEACIVEGMRAVLIEREPTYLPLIAARVSKPIATTLDFDVG